MKQYYLYGCTAIFIFITVIIQTVDPTTLNDKEEICVDKLKLNRTAIEAWNIEPLLPEDNYDIRQYLTCYWKLLGYQDENGDFNYTKIGEAVHGDLQTRFHSECIAIAAYVIDSCKNNVTGNSEGLRAIRMWNCLNIYTENLF